jgi:hypothetical protein
VDNRDWLTTYLDERQFVERVMDRIHALHTRPRKVMAWGLFCLLNLVLLVSLGADRTFLASFFALQEGLSQFFFLFLGLTFLGGLIGLVLCLDTSWLAHLRLEHPRRRQV